MSDDYLYQHGATFDPPDEFLAQLLADIDHSLPILSSPLAPLPPPSTDFSSELDAPLMCRWVSQQDPPVICGSPLPTDPKEACAHFRQAHHVRGNEKVAVQCAWHGCDAPPMLRGSLVRHVLSVHLSLLRWRCETCGKVFSRKATAHACGGGEA